MGHIIYDKSTPIIVQKTKVKEIKQDINFVNLNTPSQSHHFMDYVHRNTQKSLIFAYLIKTCFLYNSLDFYNDIHPIWCTVALGTLSYCQLKVFFFTFNKESFIIAHSGQ